MKRNGDPGKTSRGPRRDSEQPAAIAEWGWRYHHLGVPTTEKRPGERYIEACGMHVSGFEDSPYGVEWMRFEPDSPVAEIVRTHPHVAFEVDDLDRAVEEKTLIGGISSPSAGVRVAMILHGGMAVELIEFDAGRERIPDRDG